MNLIIVVVIVLVVSCLFLRSSYDPSPLGGDPIMQAVKVSADKGRKIEQRLSLEESMEKSTYDDRDSSWGAQEQPETYDNPSSSSCTYMTRPTVLSREPRYIWPRRTRVRSWWRW